MASINGGEPPESTFPLASEHTGGHPASSPPGEFNAPDGTPPTVTFSPVSGSGRTPSQSVQVDVVDPGTGEVHGLRRVLILCVYINGTTEIVYDGSAFTADFNGSSSIGSITNGTRYICFRDGDGWLDSFELRVYAFDTGGNEPTANPTTSDYTVTGGVGTGPAPDVDPPTVTAVSPTPGDDAAMTTSTPLVFDVVDDVGFHAVFVYAYFPDTGDVEVVHDGDGYMPRYVALSSRAAISGGYRYTVRRSGGWPPPRDENNPPRISLRIKAIDTGGNEAA